MARRVVLPVLRVDIRNLQVLLNRVPEQITENEMTVLFFLLKCGNHNIYTIRRGLVQLTIQCEQMNNFRRQVPNNTNRHFILTHSLSRSTFQDVRNTNEH